MYIGAMLPPFPRVACSSAFLPARLPGSPGPELVSTASNNQRTLLAWRDASSAEGMYCTYIHRVFRAFVHRSFVSETHHRRLRGQLLASRIAGTSGFRSFQRKRERKSERPLPRLGWFAARFLCLSLSRLQAFPIPPHKPSNLIAQNILCMYRISEPV